MGVAEKSEVEPGVDLGGFLEHLSALKVNGPELVSIKRLMPLGPHAADAHCSAYQQGQKSKANNIVDATDAFTGGEFAIAA